MGKKLPREQADEVLSEESPVAQDAPVEVPEAEADAAAAEEREAPGAPPAPKAEAELLTPTQWAVRKGHTNPTDPRVRGITNFRAWIFDTTREHAGWGTRVAIDVRLTESEYDAAVDAALGIALSGQ